MFSDLPPPDPGIEIVISSRGVSKGLVQTDGPQVLVRPELAIGHAYLGFYAKNVTSSAAEAEAGPSIGYRNRLGGFDLNFSATWKFSVETHGPTDDQALELAGSASRRFGPVTARASVVWSPDDLGGTTHTTYGETGLAYALRHSTSVSANIGRRERGGGPDYTAFNVGVTQNLLPGITADLRWYDTNRSALGDAFEGRFIVTLRGRF
jgi:uncharacterized protein (TIGR02001 family)